jgi:hypothetical protein
VKRDYGFVRVWLLKELASCGRERHRRPPHGTSGNNAE